MTALQKFESKWNEGKFVCVGLDSDLDQIPLSIRDREVQKHEVMFAFNKAIIEATCDIVGSYKINSAFYEAEGDAGIYALEHTVWYLKKEYSDIPTILDAKRGDIGNTNNGYVKSAFDHLGVDAITVSPYLGEDSLRPFLDQKDKLIIVLVKTSNPGSGEFQDLKLESGSKLYEYMASEMVKWNKNGNIGIVVGATYPEELASIRKTVGDIPILLPGIGAQGGEVGSTVKAGLDSNKQGIMVHSARGIIFASNGPDFAQAARTAAVKLHEEIASAISKA